MVQQAGSEDMDSGAVLEFDLGSEEGVLQAEGFFASFLGEAERSLSRG